MTRNSTDSRLRASEQWFNDFRRRRCRELHVGDLVRVTSHTKPFKGAIGIIHAIEKEGWRLAPYYLYRVELAAGLVGYEYGELELLSPANM